MVDDISLEPFFNNVVSDADIQELLKRNIRVKSGEPLELANQQSAFGELSTAELTPVVQVQFPYSINPIFLDSRANGGTLSVENNMAKLSTGASANQSAQLLSRRSVKYNPGQGGVFRGTAVFTQGVANSTQYIGIGDAFDGYFFGFEGVNFGIKRSQGGEPEVHDIDITGAADVAGGNITITLDGDAKIIAVSLNDTVDEIAAKIVAADWSGVGDGWTLEKVGDTTNEARVIFTSWSDGDKTGTFSFDDTGTTGTNAALNKLNDGVSTTKTIVAQTDWNVDGCDITKNPLNPSGITCDFTKGNVFQIKYQWLGFGSIDFSIENPDTSEFVLVHRIKYANLNTIPSVNNPTLPLCISAKNTTNTSDVIIKTGSMAGFVEGREKFLGVSRGTSTSKASIAQTELAVLSIRDKEFFQSKINRVNVLLGLISVSVDFTSTKGNVTFRTYINAGLTAEEWTDVSTLVSVVQIDTATTAFDTTVAGAAEKFALTIADKGNAILQLTPEQGFLQPGTHFTITAQASTGTATVNIATDWTELF